MGTNGIKSLLKSALPRQAHHQLRQLVKSRPKAQALKRAQNAFGQAGKNAKTLTDKDFEDWIKRYPYPPQYPWDEDALINRGRIRQGELQKLPAPGPTKRTLELGCWDGLVSGCLADAGLDATAVDYRDIGFDARATRMGAKLLQMDAAELNFEDDVFDLVFSYDALEHVGSPQKVLEEALRVVRPGGIVYLDFGPLYFSPFGEHAYESVPVPYLQFLFSEEQINRFATRAEKRPIDFAHVNRWSVGQYRKLWADLSPLAEIRFNYESTDLRHLDLIEKYPENFRARSELFDDFIVDNVKILLRRK